eukprot:9440751-Heterocapsa_arctica.AAC.1
MDMYTINRLLKLNIGLKLILCAKLSTFCEESNGDSEDARRPFGNPFQKPSNTSTYIVGR